jgi:hypothetical protein
MKYIIIFISTLFLFASCEKVVDLDLKDNQSKIVIEGNITDAAGPYFVKVSKSVDFNSTSNFPAVTNAVVTITDNMGQSENLAHTANGIYTTTTLQGIIGRTYTLKVVENGISYEAKSTMPAKVNFDSLYYREIMFGPNTIKTVTPRFTDPLTFGNNYRFVLKVNNVLDKNYFVANDNINNGRMYDRPMFSNDLEIESNNIVNVEMQCIDAQAHLYYFSLSEIAGMGPGGGAAPSNPPNGFSNGALGLFSAHTTQNINRLIP